MRKVTSSNQMFMSLQNSCVEVEPAVGGYLEMGLWGDASAIRVETS